MSNTAMDLDLRDQLALMRYEGYRNDGVVHARARELTASQYGYALHEVDAVIEGSTYTQENALESRYWTVGIAILVAMLIVFGWLLFAGLFS